MKKIISSKVGFSLTELLIVIAIIAVLTAIAIPVTTGIIEKSHEKDDDLTATLYTSYVAKFANEEPNISKYANFSDDEKIIIGYAGTNTFPGYEQGDEYFYSSNEEMWAAIRKSAIVSFKMQNPDISVSDDYFVSSPKNSDNSFIYYYIKGEIKVENLEEVMARTQQNKNSGIETFDNYWVCLDKEAGNTAEVTSSATGNVFVRLFKYGLKTRMQVQFLKNCNYSTDIYLLSASGRKYYPVNTANENFLKNNIIQFSDVPRGTYQLYITNVSNVTPLPSEEYRHLGSQSAFGEIKVYDDKSFAGESISHPYSVYLLAVTRGTLSVSLKDVYYNNDGIQDEILKDFISNYKISFTGDFNTEYNSNSPYINLYDTNQYKFLPMADYRLKFTSNGHRDFNDTITSSLWGIYHKDTPIGLNYPFDYKIIAQKNKVNVSGTIDFNSGEMIFDEVISDEMKTKINGYGINDFKQNLEFELRFKSATKTYTLTSDDLTPANTTVDGVYRFEIKDVEWTGDGTDYDFYFVNAFHDSEVKINNAPIKIEGYDVICDLSTDEFVPSKSVTFNQQISSDGATFNVPTDLTLTNIHTLSSYDFNALSSTKTIPCGFYEVNFDFSSPFTFNDKFTILITKDATFTIVKGFQGITVSGTVAPPSSGGYTTPTNFHNNIVVKIEFYNPDGTVAGYIDTTSTNGFGSRQVTVSAGSGNEATYSVLIPLSSQYKVTVTGKNSKCYNSNSATASNTSNGNFTMPKVTLSFKAGTSEDNHNGTFTPYGKTQTGHSRYCLACGLAVDGHWNDVYESVTSAATCTTNGKKTIYCDICDISLVEVNTPKSGHNMATSGTVTKKATCTAKGTQQVSCLNAGCTHKEDRDIPALGHDLTAGGGTITTYVSCTADGYRYYKCTRCTQNSTQTYKYASAWGHSYTSTGGSVYRYTTCTADGLRYHKCANGCGSSGGSTYVYETKWGHNFNSKTFCASQHTVPSAHPLSCGHGYYCHYYCSNGSCTQKPSSNKWRCWYDYGNGRRAGCSWKTCVG